MQQPYQLALNREFGNNLICHPVVCQNLTQEHLYFYYMEKKRRIQDKSEYYCFMFSNWYHFSSIPPAIAILYLLLSTGTEERVEDSLQHFKNVPNGSIAGESQEQAQ